MKGPGQGPFKIDLAWRHDTMHKRVIFRSQLLPYLLVLPQIAITVVFFFWPAYQALESSFFIEDAFGFSREWVGIQNYFSLFDEPGYVKSFRTTLIFGVSVAALAMSVALGLAVAANRVVKAVTGYRTLLIWPYAVAPALAGVIWYFMMNPSLGIGAYWLSNLGIDWNHYLNGDQALLLVIVAAAWKQVSYNFLFFLAGLQSIPRSMIEAAAIDRAGPVRRFWSIVFPLLTPTTFFLLVMNLVYAFFDTFALIHATTEGGPVDATSILVFRVYQTGFMGQDYGSSAAQSVILMGMVIVMTIIQFRYVERKVQY